MRSILLRHRKIGQGVLGILVTQYPHDPGHSTARVARRSGAREGSRPTYSAPSTWVGLGSCGSGGEIRTPLTLGPI